MPSISKVLAILAALALAGCGPIGAGGTVRPQLPDPDSRLTDPNWCGSAPAKAGEDARVTARRKELARRCEAGRVRSWNSFYGNLQKGLGN